MVLFTSKTHRRLVAIAVGALLAGSVYAQQTAPTTATDRVEGGSSAFDKYKPYADVPIGNWRSANDTVAKIGGWREYAKQAQQPDTTPVPTNKAGENMPKPATVPASKAKP